VNGRQAKRRRQTRAKHARLYVRPVRTPECFVCSVPCLGSVTYVHAAPLGVLPASAFFCPHHEDQVVAGARVSHRRAAVMLGEDPPPPLVHHFETKFELVAWMKDYDEDCARHL
jgi:hypothetical protein